MIQSLLTLAEQVTGDGGTAIVGTALYIVGVTGALGIVYRRGIASEDGRRLDALESVKALSAAQTAVKDIVKAVERLSDDNKELTEEIRRLREDLRRMGAA